MSLVAWVEMRQEAKTMKKYNRLNISRNSRKTVKSKDVAKVVKAKSNSANGKTGSKKRTLSLDGKIPPKKRTTPLVAETSPEKTTTRQEEKATSAQAVKQNKQSGRVRTSPRKNLNYEQGQQHLSIPPGRSFYDDGLFDGSFDDADNESGKSGQVNQ